MQQLRVRSFMELKSTILCNFKEKKFVSSWSVIKKFFKTSEPISFKLSAIMSHIKYSILIEEFIFFQITTYFFN